jgi:hypothetical protein
MSKSDKAAVEAAVKETERRAREVSMNGLKNSVKGGSK